MRFTTTTLALAALAVASGAGAVPPNDPLYLRDEAHPGQWNLMGTVDPAFPDAGVRGIDAERAWDITPGRPDVVIAILDSGVELTHPDLVDNIEINAAEAIAAGIADADLDGIVTLAEAALVVPDLDGDGAVTPKDVLAFASDGVDDDDNGYVDDLVGWDFEEDDNDPTDTYGHGTGRAGISAATFDNGLGMAGVCPGCRILPVRYGRTFVAAPDKLAEAVAYAADRGASASVMATGSLGNSIALREAIAYADRTGVVQCSAIGNERARHPHFPQSYEEVIAVAGVTPANRATPDDWSATWSGSNFGAHAAVAAPTYVWSTVLDGGFEVQGGTSSSVPHCGGVAGLVVSRARDLGVDLTPRQVRSILMSTADDWPVISSRRGAGRLNALRAVMAVEEGAPPDARLIAPPWFTTWSGTVSIDYEAPDGAAAVLEVGDGVEPSTWTEIDPGSLSRAPAGRDPATDVLGAAFAVTVRLTVTDGDRVTVDPRTFYLHEDAATRAGFPVDLGESIEGGPVLVDLDLDGADEIVLATSGGVVHVLDATGAELPGWPVKLGPPLVRHADAAAHASGAVSNDSASVFQTPAVGDVDGDGAPDVVVPGLDGLLYAWDAWGQLLSGFPYDLGAPSWAGAALADVDGDGRLDVVAAGYDRRVHVVTGAGETLPGFPVLAADPTATGAPPGLVATPSIGDIDGDGAIEIVVATTESERAAAFIARGRVYAFRLDGSLVDGFPVAPFGAMSETFPVVGSGVPASPLLADLDRDGAAEVIAGHAAGQLVAFRGDGSVAAAFDHGITVDLISPFGPPVALADDRYAMNVLLLGQPIAADLNGDGVPEVMAPTMGLAELDIAQAQENPGELLTMLETVFSVWYADGTLADPWPFPMEGWALFGGATVVDVDGDGAPEVLYGSDAGWLHARNAAGVEAPGFPKFVGGWMGPVAAAGDLDGDEEIDLVTATRQGQVFAWSTGTKRCGDMPWPMHHHDPRGTSHLGQPNVQTCTPVDTTPVDVAGGCACRAARGDRRPVGALAAAGLFALWVARRRRAHLRA